MKKIQKKKIFVPVAPGLAFFIQATIRPQRENRKKTVRFNDESKDVGSQLSAVHHFALRFLTEST